MSQLKENVFEKNQVLDRKRQQGKDKSEKFSLMCFWFEFQEKVFFGKLVIYWKSTSKTHLLPVSLVVFFKTRNLPSPLLNFLWNKPTVYILIRRKHDWTQQLLGVHMNVQKHYFRGIWWILLSQQQWFFSELIYPSPMLIVTDPEFYYTFSKYYLCNNSTASLLAITEFRQLKPLHSFKNIPLLSIQSGNKKKPTWKKRKGKRQPCAQGSGVQSREGWTLGRTNIHHGAEENQHGNRRQNSISVIFSV